MTGKNKWGSVCKEISPAALDHGENCQQTIPEAIMAPESGEETMVKKWAEDGARASPAGSEFAAKYIWSVFEDAFEKELKKQAER